MKRFDQLTKEQQCKAIEFAKRELVGGLESGIFETVEKLNNRQISKLAEAAAEGSFYDDEGNHLEFHYFGGCV